MMFELCSVKTYSHRPDRMLETKQMRGSESYPSKLTSDNIGGTAGNLCSDPDPTHVHEFEIIDLSAPFLFDYHVAKILNKWK